VLLSIAFLHAFPALADGVQDTRNLIHHDGVELDAGAMEVAGAKVIDARKVDDRFAAALEVE
jgi:hypothetical protein